MQSLEEASVSASKEFESSVESSNAHSYALAMKIASAQRAALEINKDRAISDMALKVPSCIHRYLKIMSYCLSCVFHFHKLLG